MFRDFTNAAKERLKGYIDDVTPHGFWDTLGDRITDFFRNIAGTDVADYAGNIKGYQKRVLDVKNIGKKNIDKLFRTEQGLDDKYSKSLSTACDSYDNGLMEV